MRRAIVFSLISLCFSAQTAFSDDRIPDYYDELGENPHRQYTTQLPSANVDPFSGKLRMLHTDLSVPLDGGGSFDVIRAYAARDNHEFVNSERSLIGLGWTMHFGRFIGRNTSPTCVDTSASSASDNHVLEMPDGTRKTFYRPSEGTSVYGSNYKGPFGDPLYVSNDRWIATCSAFNANLVLKVTSPDGTKYTYSKVVTAGGVRTDLYLTEIVDIYNNTIKLRYLGDGQPFSAYNNYPLVRDILLPNNKKIYFTYAGLTPDTTRIHFVRLQKMTYEGKVWSYQQRKISLNNFYLLENVNRPDSSRWYFNYHELASVDAGKWSLRRTVSPFGAEAYYFYKYQTFDQSGVTTVIDKVRRIANPGRGTVGGDWYYFYKPGFESFVAGKLDKTIISGPTKTEVFHHFGYQSVYNGAASGLWKMGLLDRAIVCEAHEKLSCSEARAKETTEYTWTSQQISDERISGTRGLSGFVRVPLLSNKRVSRNSTDYVTQNSNFDDYGTPLRRVEYQGSNRKESIFTSYNNPNDWVVGKIKDETILNVWNGSDPKVTRNYFAHGKLRSENVFGVENNYTYTGNGNLAKATDALGKVANFSNYSSGVAQTTTKEEGIVESKAVNADGTIASRTDANGNTTRFSYDQLFRVSSINYPLGADVGIAWNVSSNQLQSSTLTRGNLSESRQYNGFGKVTSTTQTDTSTGSSITITQSYDADNRLVFKSLPNSSAGYQYQYDVLGRLISKIFPDGNSISYSFNPSNKITVSDLRNNTTVNSYRSFGNPDERSLIKIEAPEGVTTTIERDLLDNIRTVTQAGYTREYLYNTKLQLTSTVEPEVGVTSLGRDLVGNLTSRKVGSSDTTYYVYDNLHRLSSVDFPDIQGEQNTSYDYDANSNIIQLQHQDVVRTFDYDHNDNLILDELTILDASPAVNFSVQYAYDALDNLNVITYPSDRTVAYQPDALGRSSMAGSYVSSTAYHPSGQLQEITFGNGIVTRYEVDNQRLFVNSIQSDSMDGSTLIDFSYDYDSAGNLVSLNDQILESGPWQLNYDGVNRLTSADSLDGELSYGYDGMGNILSIKLNDLSLQSYQYDLNTNQLKSISGRLSGNYNYDHYGNIIASPRGGFSYTSAGNLIASTSGRSPDYNYDGMGLLVQKTVEGATTYLFHSKDGKLLHEISPDGRSKDFVYLGNQLIALAKSGSDEESPVVTAPANITVEATSLATAVTLGVATANDAHDGALVATADNTGPFALGEHTIRWQATDAAGNVGTAIQLVMVVDTTAPVLVVPAPPGIYVISNDPVAVDLGTITATDIFTPVSISNDAPALFPVGVTTVTWTATDANGNSSTEIQTVTVSLDSTAPVVTAPANITVEATNLATAVTLGVVTANDAHDGALVATADNTGPFALGEHTIRWQATDAAGNVGTATQLVMVVDTTAPSLTVPPDIEVITNDPVAVYLGGVMGGDIFGPVSTVNDAPALFPIGVTIVTWTSTDANGNQATDTQKVTLTLPSVASGLTVTRSLPSPQREGTVYNFEATGSGGSGSYEYRYDVKGPVTSNKYKILQNYSTTASFSFDTNSYVGKNFVRVSVRNAGTKDKPVRKRMVAKVNPVSIASGLTVTRSLPSPQREGAVYNFNATGSGGSGSYDYRYEMKGPATSGKYQVVQGYRSTASFSLDTSGSVGKNVIRVSVRNTGTKDKPVRKRVKARVTAAQ